MNKIKNISKIVSYFLYFTLFSICVSAIIATFIEAGQINLNILNGMTIWLGVTVGGSWEAFAGRLTDANLNPVSLLGPLQLLPFILINIVLLRLFSLYRQGQIFSVKNTNCFRYIGWVLIGNFFIIVFYPPLLTLLLNATMDNMVLKRVIYFQDNDIIWLLIGIMMSVIGWVMAEAAKLKDEQELVI